MEFEQVLKRLVEEEVEFVLIGGYAALAHGASLLTEDVDICFRFTKENLDRLTTALAGLHPRHRITPQRIPFEITDSNWQMLKNLYLELDIGVLDCLGEVPGVGGFEQALAESEVIKLPFGNCRILKLESLIRAKEAAGRPRDLQAVTQLRCIQKKRADSSNS